MFSRYIQITTFEIHSTVHCCPIYCFFKGKNAGYEDPSTWEDQLSAEPGGTCSGAPDTIQLLIALERGWEERRQPARHNLISTPEVVESVLTRTTEDCST